MPIKRRKTMSISLGSIADGGPADPGLPSGNVSPSFDLSSCNSAYLFVITESGKNVNISPEISPDDFTTSDSSATWFSYLGTAGLSGEAALPDNPYPVSAGNQAVPFPPAYSSYGAAGGNITSLATRRMRVKNVDGAGGGDIMSAHIIGHRRVI